MRDLHAVAGGLPETEETTPAELAADVDEKIRAVRREQRQAGIAVMLLDTAKVLEPLIELLCDRALRWAALGCTLGLAIYAMRQPSWERAAIVAGFAILSPWVAGTRKAKP